MTELRTVLVVDDDKEWRQLLVRLLGDHGWRVLEAANGQAAVEYAERQPLDLVLLDLRMPGPVDGLRAATLMRQIPALKHVPVIALSASPYKEYRGRAFAAGCTDFLSKPIKLRDLLTYIDRLKVPTAAR